MDERINATNPSRENGKRTIEEQELFRLRKENQLLRIENDVLSNNADIRMKVIVIKTNVRKYSISSLCRCSGIG